MSGINQEAPPPCFLCNPVVQRRIAAGNHNQEDSLQILLPEVPGLIIDAACLGMVAYRIDGFGGDYAYWRTRTHQCFDLPRGNRSSTNHQAATIHNIGEQGERSHMGIIKII